MTEERTCKTCAHFHNGAYFCFLHGEPQAEWDSCEGHVTYDEIVEKAKQIELNMIKVGGSEFHKEAKETLLDVLAHAQVDGYITNITSLYILAKFDDDRRVVTKPDGIYLSPEQISAKNGGERTQ